MLGEDGAVHESGQPLRGRTTARLCALRPGALRDHGDVVVGVHVGELLPGAGEPDLGVRGRAARVGTSALRDQEHEQRQGQQEQGEQPQSDALEDRQQEGEDLRARLLQRGASLFASLCACGGSSASDRGCSGTVGCSGSCSPSVMALGSIAYCGVASTGIHSSPDARTSTQALMFAPVQTSVQAGIPGTSSAVASRAPSTTRDSRPQCCARSAAATENCSSSPTADTSSSGSASGPARRSCSVSSVNSSSMRAAECPA